MLAGVMVKRYTVDNELLKNHETEFEVIYRNCKIKKVDSGDVNLKNEVDGRILAVKEMKEVIQQFDRSFP